MTHNEELKFWSDIYLASIKSFGHRHGTIGEFNTPRFNANITAKKVSDQALQDFRIKEAELLKRI